jgi:hypothetical protein
MAVPDRDADPTAEGYLQPAGVVEAAARVALEGARRAEAAVAVDVEPVPWDRPTPVDAMDAMDATDAERDLP